jgi:hypothetical protein
MGWLLFESGVALLVLVAIVAWTMAPLRKRGKGSGTRFAAPPEESPRADRESRL